MATRLRSFQAVSLLHYQGSSRAVRVWDEAWSPGLTIELYRDSIAGLWEPAAIVSGAFRDALEELTMRLASVADESLVEIPDWERDFGVTEMDLLGAIRGTQGAYRNGKELAASRLFVVAGKTVRVRRAEGSKRVVISFEDTLPADLAPLVVLDASIRVRQTYADAVAFRGVKRLRKAVKRYDPLTVNLWTSSGSKSGWKSNGPVLMEGIAATVQSKLGEEWLIVHHRDVRGDTFEATLRRLLPQAMEGRVSFLSWGRNVAWPAPR